MSASMSDSISQTDSVQMNPSDVLSRGSTKPDALPIATTLSTHDRWRWPLTNLTMRVGPTLGFLARNSASASASEMKAEP